MAWRRKEPRHQHAWYWQFLPEYPCLSITFATIHSNMFFAKQYHLVLDDISVTFLCPSIPMAISQHKCRLIQHPWLYTHHCECWRQSIFCCWTPNIFSNHEYIISSCLRCSWSRNWKHIYRNIHSVCRHLLHFIHSIVNFGSIWVIHSYLTGLLHWHWHGGRCQWKLLNGILEINR